MLIIYLHSNNMILSLYKLLLLYAKKEKRSHIKNNIHKFVSILCPSIDYDYILNKVNDKNYRLLFYSINTSLTKNTIRNEVVGCLLYKTILNDKSKKRIYISLIGIQPQVSGNGYGKIFLEEFIGNQKRVDQQLEIVLLSLPSAKDFYISMGFMEGRCRYIEKNEEIGENIILIKSV